MNATDYDAFLKRKQRVDKPSGFEPGSLNAALFPFQRDIVTWACRRGRAAIFADCGLGKTLMQLDWSRLVHKETGRPVLILAPLAVSGQTLHKQLKKDACMSRQGIADYVVTVRKPGENPQPVANTNESFPVSEWQQYASPIWSDINPNDTLQGRSARDEEDERHICPLQLEVIRRCLRLWSRPGDLVLSPFAGIGSEGYEAVKGGRRFVGVELKRSYWEQAVANLGNAEKAGKQASMFAEVG